jgi:hypothetical protein
MTAMLDLVNIVRTLLACLNQPKILHFCQPSEGIRLNNSGGHFLPDLQYITLENGFFERKLDQKN